MDFAMTNETKDPLAPGVDFSSDAILTLARDPAAFRGRFSGVGFPDAVSSVLEKHRLTDPEVLALLNSLQHERGDSWITSGTVAVPASPIGVANLRRLRVRARDYMRQRISDFATLGSRVRTLYDSAASAASASDIFRGLETQRGDELHEGAIGLRLTFENSALDGLPRGHKPEPFRVAPLVGRTFEGSRIEEWRSDTDACIEGTVDFLSMIGVSYETETESDGDCSCGECCGSEEPYEVSYCADFVLDEKTVRLLDKAGFGDATRQFFECEDGGEWSDVAELDDTEMADRIGPAPMVDDGDEIQTVDGVRVIVDKKREAGVSYSATDWAFVPDFEALEMDGVPFSDVSRILPLIVRMVDACALRGILPPVAGSLHKSAHPYRYGSTVDASPRNLWAWDPDAATLTHSPTTGLRIVHDCETGGLSVHNEGRRIGMDDKHEFHVPAYEAGDAASIWFGVSRGSI